MENNKILSNDISIVIQGAVCKTTARCIRTAREILPRAEIILSTWEGTLAEELNCDKIVYSADPGSFPCDAKDVSIPNNINRQLRSTQKGVAVASRKYVIKIRSDFFFKDTGFLDLFVKYNKDNNEQTFFEKRLIACTTYSRNPRYTFSDLVMPYSPSDFFFFGLKEDVKLLFDRPLITKREEKQFFDIHDEMRKSLRYKDALCQWMPEQSLWIAFLQKFIPDIYCKHRDDINPKNIMLTEKSFACNLILATKEKIGIETEKKKLFSKGVPETCFSMEDWENLYDYYCHGDNAAFKQYQKRVRINEKRYKYGVSLMQKGNHKKNMGTEIDNLHKCIALIKDNSVVSFDVFDTLLFRRISPDWAVMAQTGDYAMLLLKRYTKDITAAKFNDLRNYFIGCEYQKNNLSGYDEEYNLRDIFRKILINFNIPKDKVIALADQLAKNELLRESNVLYTNPEAIEVLAALKKRPIKIIAISDMYFSKEDMQWLFREKKLDTYFDSIFVSSEYNKTKRSGRLFCEVINQLNCSPSQVTHIGDNEESDVQNAISVGINGIWYRNHDNQLRKQEQEKAVLLFKDMDQTYIKRKQDEKLPIFEKYISQCFSFDFINFVYALVFLFADWNIDTAFFLERDANIFKTLYEKIIARLSLEDIIIPKLKLLKLPRRDSACLSNIEDPIAVIERAWRVNPPNHFKITHIIGCFGLELSDFSNEVQEDIVNHDNDRNYFCEIYKNIIFPKIQGRRVNITKKLTDNDFFKAKKLALVDIGWGGTAQRDIQDFLTANHTEIKCYGAYYACDERARGIGGPYFGYRNANQLLYGYSLIEFLVKEYKEPADGTLSDELATTYELNKRSRNQILKDCDEFVELIKSRAMNVACAFHYIDPYIKNIISNPELEFVQVIKDVKFSLDRKNNDSYMHLVDSVEKRVDIQPQYLTAQWVQGSLIASGLSVSPKWLRLRNWINRYPTIKKCCMRIIYSLHLGKRFDI